MAEKKTVFLSCPAWEEDREYDIEHARNVLEIEKTAPSGITLAKGQVLPPKPEKTTDAAITASNTGDTKQGNKSGSGKK